MVVFSFKWNSKVLSKVTVVCSKSFGSVEGKKWTGKNVLDGKHQHWHIYGTTQKCSEIEMNKMNAYVEEKRSVVSTFVQSKNPLHQQKAISQYPAL